MTKLYSGTNRKQIGSSIGMAGLLFTVYFLDILLMSSNYFYNIFSVLGLYVPFVIIAIISVFYLIELKRDKFDILIVLFLYFPIVQILNGGAVRFMNEYIVLLYIGLVYFVFSRSRCSIGVIRAMLIVYGIVWVSWSVFNRNYYEAFGSSNGNMFNSNTVAQLIFITYASYEVLGRYSDTGVVRNKQLISFPKNYIRNKLLNIIFTVISVVAVWECDSRGTLLAFVFFFLIKFFIKPFFWNKKRLVIVTIVIIAVGLVVPLVYLGLSTNTELHDIVYQYTGKSFYTGREWIWTQFYNEFSRSRKYMLFGVNNDAHYIHGVNLHNTYLSILGWFGIFGMVIYTLICIRIVLTCFERTEKNCKKRTVWCIYMFWAFLVAGGYETILIWSNFIPLVYSLISLFCNEKFIRCLKLRVNSN